MCYNMVADVYTNLETYIATYSDKITPDCVLLSEELSLTISSYSADLSIIMKDSELLKSIDAELYTLLMNHSVLSQTLKVCTVC